MGEGGPAGSEVKLRLNPLGVISGEPRQRPGRDEAGPGLQEASSGPSPNGPHTPDAQGAGRGITGDSS